MGWLFINLSVFARSIQEGTLSQSMILFQLFCAVILDPILDVYFPKDKSVYLCMFIIFVLLYMFQSGVLCIYKNVVVLAHHHR